MAELKGSKIGGTKKKERNLMRRVEKEAFSLFSLPRKQHKVSKTTAMPFSTSRI